MDLMTRELEQMSASSETNVANLFVQFSVAPGPSFRLCRAISCEQTSCRTFFF